MDRLELFRRTVHELADIVADPQDEYRMLHSSALLRRLLIDEHPLLHQVNRERQLQIRFEVAAEDDYTRMVLEDGAAFWAPLDGFSPRLAGRPRQPELLKLPEFLARRVARIRGVDISVKAVILQAANVDGGVHAGTARSDLEQLIAEHADFFVGNTPALVRSLRGIADVVVLALVDLAR